MTDNNNGISEKEAQELRELGAKGKELRKQVEKAQEKYLQTQSKKDYERHKRAMNRRTRFIRQNLPDVPLPPLMTSLLMNMAESERKDKS